MPAPFQMKRTTGLPLWSPGSRRCSSSTFSQAPTYPSSASIVVRREDRGSGVGEPLEQQRLVPRGDVAAPIGGLDPLGVRRDQVHLARLQRLRQLLQVTVRITQQLTQGDLVVACRERRVVPDGGLQRGRRKALAGGADPSGGGRQARGAVERRQAKGRVAHGG